MSVDMVLTPKRRRAAGQVCELIPLFDLGQPTISHHLKVLRDAGLVDVRRRGIWAYYHVLPGSLDRLDDWLSGFRDRE